MEHNIKLLNGEQTNPNETLISDNSVFKNTILFLKNILKKEFNNYSLHDLGCLDGGYSVEFAKVGFQTIGVEIRKKNYENCLFFKKHFNLPNLNFINDDVLNVENYENFDITFCSGLLYHLDNPVEVLEKITKKTNKILILNTHYIDFDESSKFHEKYKLSKTTINEGLRGRWYTEFYDEKTYINKEPYVFSSYNNNKSFWLNKNELIELLYKMGYSLVLEDLGTRWFDVNQNESCRSTFFCLK
jgi:hypothetical protein